MNFQQLEYVLAVHKRKHFGEAAEACNITQATLSAMIKKLEEELDVVLFDRSRKPVKTTDAGLKFVEIAKDIMTQQRSLLDLGQKSSQTIEGDLAIGIIPTVANALLPEVLPSILEENPDLNLSVVEITTEEIKQQLMLDKIDMGILATPINDEQFHEHILYYESMMIYGISDSTKRFVSSEDVKDSNIWLLEEGHCFREQAQTICEIKEKAQTSNLNFKGSSFETLLSLTDKFGGFTLIPELYFQSLPESRQQFARSFNYPVPVREISILTYRQYAQKFTIDYLTRKIQESIQPKLSTRKLKNSEMEIIDI